VQVEEVTQPIRLYANPDDYDVFPNHIINTFLERYQHVRVTIRPTIRNNNQNPLFFKAFRKHFFPAIVNASGM
jgi:hypothetical protein